MNALVISEILRYTHTQRQTKILLLYYEDNQGYRDKSIESHINLPQNTKVFGI